MVNDDLIWAAAKVKPNQINRAELNLKNQGITYFAPKIKVTKRQATRFISKEQLFFPGYIFVRINLTGDDIRHVHATYGMGGVLMNHTNSPGVIPDAFIDTMMAHIHDGLLQSKPDFVPGQKLRIIHGPFAGLVAELIDSDADGRIRCLFDVLSGKIEARMNISDVMRL
jgi:transcriptional antiterminator RfaH